MYAYVYNICVCVCVCVCIRTTRYIDTDTDTDLSIDMCKASILAPHPGRGRRWVERFARKQLEELHRHILKEDKRRSGETYTCLTQCSVIRHHVPCEVYYRCVSRNHTMCIMSV